MFPRLFIRVNNLSTIEAKKYCENVRLGSMVTTVLVTQQNAVRASCTQMPKKTHSYLPMLFFFPVPGVLLTVEITYFFFYGFAEGKSKISVICIINILLNGEVRIFTAVKKKIAT